MTATPDTPSPTNSPAGIVVSDACSPSVDDLWDEYIRLTDAWKSLPYGSPEQATAFKEADEAHDRWRFAFLDSENNEVVATAAEDATSN